MNRREIEQELRAMTKKELLALASEAGIVNRYRMTKDSLVEALTVPRIHQSLPGSPDLLYDLGRKELLELCELAGEKVKSRSRKTDLIHTLEQRIGGGKQGGEEVAVLSEAAVSERLEPVLDRDESKGGHRLDAAAGLPESFKESKVVLLPVHPYLVHVYWEVSQSDIQKARARFGRERSRFQPVLRFFDVSMVPPDGGSNDDFFDVPIELEPGQWYVDLWSPQRSYYVELGLRNGRGRFLAVCRSRVVDTPPAWPSPKEDDRYVRLDDDGDLVEVPVEEIGLPGSQIEVAAASQGEVASETGWFSEIRNGGRSGVVEGDGSEGSRRAESEARTADSSSVPPGTLRPDITTMCEKLAGLGVSSGSRLSPTETGSSNS